MQLLIHTDDPRDAGHDAPGEERDGAFITSEPCPRCGVTPLRARPLDGCKKRHGQHVFHAAACSICGKHVGTLKALVSYWDEREDDAVLNGRARVYGGRQVEEGHGDRAAEQFDNELRARGGE